MCLGGGDWEWSVSQTKGVCWPSQEHKKLGYFSTGWNVSAPAGENRAEYFNIIFLYIYFLFFSFTPLLLSSQLPFTTDFILSLLISSVHRAHQSWSLIVCCVKYLFTPSFLCSSLLKRWLSNFTPLSSLCHLPHLLGALSLKNDSYCFTFWCSATRPLKF